MNPVDREWLLDVLEQGGRIMTANERLARQLQLVHAEHCRTLGIAVWSRPAIHSWQAWLHVCQDGLLERALDDGVPPPVVLNAHQAEAVWQQIIENSAAGSGLLRTDATAASAAEAWDFLCGWQVTLAELDRYDHDDVNAFTGWARAYMSRSQQEGWLDNARLADCIAEAVRGDRLVPPPLIYLAGFDEMRPQQQALLNALAEHGSDIRTLAGMESTATSIVQYPCTDARDEIYNAACWARQQLADDLQLTIGIVVQDLTAQRDAIARLFDEVLCPEVRLSETDGVRPYNISLGRPLSRMPLVRDALLALELAGGPVEWKTVSALLRSPFLAGTDTEADARARLDARLRRLGRDRISLGDLHYHAGRAGCPMLLRTVEQCQSLVEQIRGQQSAGTHATHISEWLAAVGWSRGRPLSSEEYQTANAWWELLGEFAALDAYTGQFSWSQAIARLRRLAGNKLFQPQSAVAPVQIMGLLEAAGLQFDRLWVMGLHDDVWPASPRPQPLLPIPLQRQYELPHATAERELEFATRTTRRLLTSAPQIVMSWPGRDGDAELRPSPLLADLPHAGEAVKAAPLLRQWLHDHAPALERYADSAPPSLQATEPLHGGTAILRNQAACPFRAFAEHRLHARVLEEPMPGLDAAGRGALVHEVMRVIWDELRDQSALLELDQQAQHELVGRCIETALVDWETKNAGQLPQRFRQVEAARLRSLASDWLQLDRERTPFSVEARESRQTIRIEGLELNGRIDRLDRLPDDSKLIIDYKTGRVNTRVWLDERPDDPQLPLYALGQREHLAGIAFAQLRIGDLKYAGVADRAELAPGIEAVAAWKAAPADCQALPDLIDYWQRQLSALARSFGQGDSEVDPKDPRQTCRYCPQSTLCRIDELSLGAHDLGEDDG